MTTTMAARPRTKGRIRRNIGMLPSRTERKDMNTPCRQCGGTPTRLIGRGNVATERSCHTCGHIEYLDAPDLAL